MLCRLVGKGHNMPVPLHLETKWHYAILAQGAEVGEEISLPLELACYDLSFLEQDLKAMAWAEGGGDFWHQQWCLSTPLTAWAAASQVPLAMVAGLRMSGVS